MKSRIRRAVAWGAPVLVTLLAWTPVRAQQKGTIVFVGSSIFHRWTQLDAQMAPLPVRNIAFDGALTDDWNRLIDARVVPLAPAVVVYYCGSNDVDTGDAAAAIVGRIRTFIERLAAALPKTTFVFVAVNKAPEKRDRWDVVDDINRRVQQYAAAHPRVRFVDVNPVLLDAGGAPRMELFMNDRLHLRPAAYDGFAKMLKPVLEQALTRP